MPSKDLGPVKRLGVRYGRTPKYKLAQIEIEQKTKKPCPYCTKKTVTREAAGIYFCEHCKIQFTGKAYTFHTTTSATRPSPLTETPQPVPEIEE